MEIEESKEDAVGFLTKTFNNDELAMIDPWLESFLQAPYVTVKIEGYVAVKEHVVITISYVKYRHY
jgi:hypothetical protein